MHFIIVLGCGRGLEKINGKLSLTHKSHMTFRLLKAIEVYSGLDTDEKVIVCSGGGSGEAGMMKDFLVERGIPESRMLLEPYSKTTIENCIFTYELIHDYIHSEPTIQGLDGIDVGNIQQLDSLRIDELQLINLDEIHLHVVTNEYHLRRSLFIFQYFMIRIYKYANVKCRLHGHGCDIGEEDKWNEEESRAMINLPLQLEKLRTWYPSSQDYGKRVKEGVK